jgi:DNA-binding XRE family transcriptional regulator
MNKERRADMANDLKRIRISKGYTQVKFAKMLGITHFHLNKIENGEKNLTAALGYKAAQLLGVSLDEIFLNKN